MPRRRGLKFRYPKLIEAKYRNMLLSIVNSMKDVVKGELSRSRIKELVEMADRNRQDSIRADADNAWFTGAMVNLKRLEVGLKKKIPKTSIYAKDIGQKTHKWHDEQWRRVMKRVVGVDLYGQMPHMKELVDEFVSDNTQLIKKLTRETTNDINRILLDGIQAGDRHETIYKRIFNGTDLEAGRFKKTENRAKLIARDQVGTLNYRLSRERMDDLDIEEYEWQTSDDERVRGCPYGKYPDAKYSHFDRDGKTFKWSDPPPDGHAGQAIACRCTAIPLIDELTEEKIKNKAKSPTTKKKAPQPKPKPVPKPEPKPKPEPEHEPPFTPVNDADKIPMSSYPDNMEWALKKYPDEYKDLNNAIRNMPPIGAELDDPYLESIKEGIDKAFMISKPLEKNVTVYRGLDLSDSDFKKMFKGPAFREKGFSAVTTDFDKAKNFALGSGDEHVVMSITVKKGTKVVKIPDTNYEYLLPRQTNLSEYVIKDVQKRDGIVYIKAEFKDKTRKRNLISNALGSSGASIDRDEFDRLSIAPQSYPTRNAKEMGDRFDEVGLGEWRVDMKEFKKHHIPERAWNDLAERMEWYRENLNIQLKQVLFYSQGREGVMAAMNGNGYFFWGRGVANRSKAEFLKVADEMVERGWWPKNVNGKGYKFLIDHEFGHYIQLGDMNDRFGEVKKIYDSLSAIEIHKQLSKYGSSSYEEFFAEAWCEYTNSPTPRPLAKKVGETIVNALAGGN